MSTDRNAAVSGATQRSRIVTHSPASPPSTSAQQTAKAIRRPAACRVTAPCPRGATATTTVRDSAGEGSVGGAGRVLAQRRSAARWASYCRPPSPRGDDQGFPLACYVATVNAGRRRTTRSPRLGLRRLRPADFLKTSATRPHGGPSWGSPARPRQLPGPCPDDRHPLPSSRRCSPGAPPAPGSSAGPLRGPVQTRSNYASDGAWKPALIH